MFKNEIKDTIEKNTVDSAIQFSTKNDFTAYYLHEDRPPAWELT